MEESMARASEDLHGLVIGEGDGGADWVTDSSSEPHAAHSASVRTDPDIF